MTLHCACMEVCLLSRCLESGCITPLFYFCVRVSRNVYRAVAWQCGDMSQYCFEWHTQQDATRKDLTWQCYLITGLYLGHVVLWRICSGKYFLSISENELQFFFYFGPWVINCTCSTQGHPTAYRYVCSGTADVTVNMTQYTRTTGVYNKAHSV
jgi:hypothetical protein